jgi:glycosyltransferase involved in cell wall biosynthesis
VDSHFYFSPAVTGPNESSYRPFAPVCPPKSLGDRVRRHARRWHWLRREKKHVASRPAGSDLFSGAELHYPTPYRPAKTPANVIHLHWVAQFLDYPSFFASLPDQQPIVWTLHDMNPLTGGCHYTWGCDKYQSECSRCPQLAHAGADDLSFETFATKRTALAGKNIHVAADSHWLESEARKSAVFRCAKSFCTIHYGLDMETYRPLDKAACRRELGIEPDHFVVCFGADAVDIPRKGMKELLAALSLLNDKARILCLVFGSGVTPPAGLEIKSLGYVPSGSEQVRLYSAADIFVIPSLQEAFGQTSLEAMACGTPVVGFNTGGIPDTVRDGETGLLAQPGSVEDLADKIQWMLDHPAERLAMGARARAFVAAHFTLRQQAEKYRELYATIAAS